MFAASTKALRHPLIVKTRQALRECGADDRRIRVLRGVRSATRAVAGYEHRYAEPSSGRLDDGFPSGNSLASPSIDRTYYAVFFFAAQRAFIIADNFFRIAALIGLRPARFFVAALGFVCAVSRFCLAHRARWAAPILARAARLMRRLFALLGDLAWPAFCARPRRAGWEPSRARAAIARSIRLASSLSCDNTL